MEIFEGNQPSSPDWFEKVSELFKRRYTLAGWSQDIYRNDLAILKGICGDKHPKDIYLQDLEEKVLRAKTQGSRETYVGRIKSIFNTLRILGIIPLEHHPDLGLPKIKVKRATPRPLSKDQAIMLMTKANQPMREWFTLACLGGLRAIEISRIEGSWLEVHDDSYMLRIWGKGDTDLLIPAHPKIVELIQSKKTLGRLYPIQSNYLSRTACEEMRRMGIETRGSQGTKSRLTFHSCRHFFATAVLAESGNSIVLTSRVMRHMSPVVTMRYADLVNGEERRVVGGLLSDVDWDGGGVASLSPVLRLCL